MIPLYRAGGFLLFLAVANGQQDGELVGAGILQELVICAGLRGDAQAVLAVGEALGHLHDLLGGGAAGVVLHLHRLRVRLVLREVDAVRRIVPFHEQVRPRDDEVLARRNLAVHAPGTHVRHLVDDRTGGRLVQVEGHLLQRVQQRLAGGEGHAHLVLLRVELGRLAVEHAGEVQQVLPHAVHEALAARDGLHPLLVGKLEDVHDGLLAILGTLAHDVVRHVLVAVGAGYHGLGGEVARLGGQYVVVQVRVQDNLCHVYL